MLRWVVAYVVAAVLYGVTYLQPESPWVIVGLAGCAAVVGILAARQAGHHGRGA